MGGDCLNVRANIEHSSYAGHNSGQGSNLGKTDCNAQALPLRKVRYFDVADKAVNLNGTPITSVFNDFNAGNCTRLQIAEHRIPVIRWTITKPERHACIVARPACGSLSP